MAWALTLVDRDDEHATMVAVWDAGGPNEFTYRERIQRSLTMEQASALKDRAEAARNAKFSKRTWLANAKSVLQSIFA